MVSSLTSSDRIAGGLWGLLVGDALGVPYEFAPPNRIPTSDRIEMKPPRDFHRAYLGIPPGTWSDDGAQALCLLGSLLARGRVDPDDLMDRLARWFRDGYLAVEGEVFDVGMQTRRVLERFLAGTGTAPSCACCRWPSGTGGRTGSSSLMPFCSPA
jgi:ADP-ribosylglycohydrolase